MLRRTGPCLSLCRHARLRLAPARPSCRLLNTSVHYADQGFFTPSSSATSPPPRPPNDDRGGHERVSDHEYTLRVGRAYDLLRATIPHFMRTGLVDYHDDQKSHPSRLTLLDVFAFRDLRAKSSSSDATGEDERATSATAAEQVYDSSIHFRFCPAPPSSTSTPGNEPELTEEDFGSLSFSGRSLYFASAHILRHTLNALFSDSRIEVHKIRLESRADMPRVEDVLHLRLEFAGHLRVTGQEHNYTLIFRYDFDQDTGRIMRHTVERVEPAIGRKLWTVLATVWQRLIGHEPTPVPSACHMRSARGRAAQG